MNRAAKLAQLRTFYKDTLRPLIPPGAPVALLDFPNHANVGDSAIWLGELEFLRQNDSKVTYVSDCYSRFHSDTALRDQVGKGIILLHGGGNFGDLYPIHQKFREKIIAAFPANRIIQFPQSAHFQDLDFLAATVENYKKHNDLHLLARDKPSFDFIVQNFHNPVHLCPDSALFLEVAPFGAKKSARPPIVFLCREDKESNADHFKVQGITTTDWMEERLPRWTNAYSWVQRRIHWKSRIPLAALARASCYFTRSIAEERLERGLQILSSGKSIGTDRLHAMILGWLGGSETFYIENSYGKLSNFVNSWLRDTDGLTPCTSFEEANSLSRNVHGNSK